MKAFFLTLGLFVFVPELGLAQEWEVAGRQGAIVFVYVEPAAVEDKFFIAQVLHVVVRKTSGPVQVMIFDQKKYTPRAFPMTDSQMTHLRAQYNRNPARSHERFLWVHLSDPNSSPPKLRFVEARIRPGYAE